MATTMPMRISSGANTDRPNQSAPTNNIAPAKAVIGKE